MNDCPTGVTQAIDQVLGDMGRTGPGIDTNGDGPLLAVFAKKKSKSPTDVKTKLRGKKSPGGTADTGGPKK